VVEEKPAPAGQLRARYRTATPIMNFGDRLGLEAAARPGSTAAEVAFRTPPQVLPSRQPV